jgi:hypothetical protein
MIPLTRILPRARICCVSPVLYHVAASLRDPVPLLPAAAQPRPLLHWLHFSTSPLLPRQRQPAYRSLLHSGLLPLYPACAASPVDAASPRDPASLYHPTADCAAAPPRPLLHWLHFSTSSIQCLPRQRQPACQSLLLSGIRPNFCQLRRSRSRYCIGSTSATPLPAAVAAASMSVAAAQRSTAAKADCAASPVDAASPRDPAPLYHPTATVPRRSRGRNCIGSTSATPMPAAAQPRPLDASDVAASQAFKSRHFFFVFLSEHMRTFASTHIFPFLFLLLLFLVMNLCCLLL